MTADDPLECTSITAEIIPRFRLHAWTMLAAVNGTDRRTARTGTKLDRPIPFTGS